MHSIRVWRSWLMLPWRTECGDGPFSSQEDQLIIHPASGDKQTHACHQGVAQLAHVTSEDRV